MKLKKKYFIPCALLVIAGGFAARAEQQQFQDPGLTEQQKIDKRNAFMLQTATDMLKRKPDVLKQPIVLTIRVGSRSDLFALDTKAQVFTRIPSSSTSKMQISAEVPILGQCGIGFTYNGAEPTVVSELSINGTELTDTLTIPDRGSVPVSMEMDKNQNFFFPDSSQQALESIQQDTIKAGLKGSVENFNNMFANLGYKIDLDDAQIDDSRDVFHQAQIRESDPDDVCAKIKADIQAPKLDEKSDSTVNPFGSIITSSGVTSTSWSITYNAYTITISVVPRKI